MHSALVIVEKPNRPMPSQRQVDDMWRTFVSGRESALHRHQGGPIEQLSDNCLLLTLAGNSADVLADVLHAASESGLPYRVLFFEKAPQWITSAGVT